MQLELKDLKYYLIPGEGVDSAYAPLYTEAYRMWREVWSQTFLELDGSAQIFSDDFTRQSLIGAIFFKDQCVAMSVHHEVNFEYLAAREDSYFKAWPKEAMAELVRNGKDVLICSHLTVASAFRGEVIPGLSLKNLTMAMSVRLLLDSEFSVMTGTMRNNRGAQRTAYATGATPIMANAQMHGVDVDLVGWYKDEVLKNTNLNDHLWTSSLWASHQEIPVINKQQKRSRKTA